MSKALSLSDVSLRWYTAGELFDIGYTRGTLDRQVIEKTIRAVHGAELKAFAEANGLSLPSVSIREVYYDIDWEAQAKETALAHLSQAGVFCATCKRHFPPHQLIYDRYRRQHCTACIYQAQKRNQ